MRLKRKGKESPLKNVYGVLTLYYLIRVIPMDNLRNFLNKNLVKCYKYDIFQRIKIEEMEEYLFIHLVNITILEVEIIFKEKSFYIEKPFL